MVAHGLPTQPTPFIGRTQELTALLKMLGEPTCRLMTLVGPGGIGKTRLALEVARHSSLPDDVYYVPLQPLSAPDSMVSSIAEMLQLQFHSGSDPRQQLLDFLREKSLLLILDNFEHLLEGVSLLTDILETAPQTRFLITSRERLNVREEWVLDVNGLPYPASASDSTLENCDAVNLFLLYARRARADFDFTDHEEAISRICRMVEGMPLGIELAAARVRVLPCEVIADEMARSLDILETSARNVEPRHRTMRAAFDPTWERLSDDERAVFRKLSVFRGGFTREAAESVAGASLALLSSLVDKSLVRLQANGRYDLHELLRQYSAEQLNNLSDERDPTRDLHCAYFAVLLNQQESHLNGSKQKAALAVIEADIENVRLGWQRAVQNRDAEIIGQFVDSLVFFYDARCWFDEGEKVFGGAAEALSQINLDDNGKLIYGKVLVRQGFCCIQTLHTSQAKSLIEKGLAILRALDARREVAYALQKFAHLQNEYNDFAVATVLLQESLTLYREVGDAVGTAWLLYWLGLEAYFVDDYEEARRYCEEGLALYREMDNPAGLAGCQSVLGWCAYYQEAFGEAKHIFQNVYQLAYQAGNNWDIMESLVGLGMTMLALGEYTGAITHLHEGLSRAVEVGKQIVGALPPALVELAPIFARQGDKAQAIAFLSHALHHQYMPLGSTLENRARSLLTQLQAETPADEFLAAVERGNTLNLKSIVTALMPHLPAIQHDFEAQAARQASHLLSEREAVVLRLVADGMNNREIAEQLVVAVSTVKWYINEIFHKLDVSSRAEAVSRGRALGLVVHLPDNSTY